jgi:hypothetical protein
MTTAIAAVLPTQPQIDRLAALGISIVPQTRSEASALITAAIAERDMRPATMAQRGRAAALGGRDLPGSGVREISTQIFLLEALALIDGAADATAMAEGTALLVDRVRERLTKPIRITVPAAPVTA